MSWTTRTSTASASSQGGRKFASAAGSLAVGKDSTLSRLPQSVSSARSAASAGRPGPSSDSTGGRSRSSALSAGASTRSTKAAAPTITMTKSARMRGITVFDYSRQFLEWLPPGRAGRSARAAALGSLKAWMIEQAMPWHEVDPRAAGFDGCPLRVRLSHVHVRGRSPPRIRPSTRRRNPGSRGRPAESPSRRGGRPSGGPLEPGLRDRVGSRSADPRVPSGR